VGKGLTQNALCGLRFAKDAEFGISSGRETVTKKSIFWLTVYAQRSSRVRTRHVEVLS
jgi:hypothetical protein